MSKRINLGEASDNSVYLEGFLDETDPKETNGDPKWINDADVTWTLLDSSGNTLASGTATAVGSGGRYRCDLGWNINYTLAYQFVMVAIKSGKKATYRSFVDVITRTGESQST